jgi:hypothetical protein
VVSPHGHLLDIGYLGAGLKGKLSESSVVIKSGHGSEAAGRQVRGVVLANQSVGVGGVADDDSLNVTGSVVVNSFTNRHEDLAVVLEEVSSLHTRSTGLGSNEEVVVDILEGGVQIRSDHDLVEEGEGAIMELSLNTLEDLLLEGKVKQVKDDALVLAEEFTTDKGQ